MFAALNSDIGSEAAAVPWLDVYLGCAPLLLLGAALGSRAARLAPWLDAAMAAGSCAVTLLASLASGTPFGPSAYASFCVVGGAFMARCYIRWAVVLSRRPIRAGIASSAAKAVLALLVPAAAVAAATAMPALSWLFLRRAQREEPEADRYVPITRDDYLGLAGLVLVAASLACIATMAAAGGGVGQAGSTGEVLLALLVKVALLLGVLHAVSARDSQLGSAQFLAVIVLCCSVSLAGSYFREPRLRPVAYAGALLSIDLLVLFYWSALMDVAHRFAKDSYVVVGLGWLAYVVPRSLGKHLYEAAALGVGAAGTAFALALCLLGVSSLLLAMGSRDFFSRLFTDVPALPDEAGEASGGRPEEAACEEARLRFGLTQREADVLAMLLRGRSRRYIAESLVISENTVKNHVKHIYAKMGVHNRDELLASLGL